MTFVRRLSSGLLLALGVSLVAEAHDPALHKNKGAEAPNCAALDGMDASRAESADPITRALLKKCMQELHPEADDASQDAHPRHQDHGRHQDQGGQQGHSGH